MIPGNNRPHASVWDNMYGNNGEILYHDITSNNILSIIQGVYDRTIGRYFGIREIEGKTMFKNLPKGYTLPETTQNNSTIDPIRLFNETKFVGGQQRGGRKRKTARRYRTTRNVVRNRKSTTRRKDGRYKKKSV